jgi:hypothetical protein
MTPSPGDVLVIWNRYGRFAAEADRFEAAGCDVLVCENGYVGRDAEGRQYYAIALGGHNGAGRYYVGGAERWERLGIALKPWRTDGEHVLVCPQRGIGPPGVAMPRDWARDVVQRLGAFTGRRIVVRPHPGNRPPERSLSADLDGVWAMVVWSSNCATEALIEGVPAMVGGGDRPRRAV